MDVPTAVVHTPRVEMSLRPPEVGHSCADATKVTSVMDSAVVAKDIKHTALNALVSWRHPTQLFYALIVEGVFTLFYVISDLSK